MELQDLAQKSNDASAIARLESQVQLLTQLLTGAAQAPRPMSVAVIPTTPATVTPVAAPQAQGWAPVPEGWVPGQPVPRADGLPRPAQLREVAPPGTTVEVPEEEPPWWQETNWGPWPGKRLAAQQPPEPPPHK
jgi:hypothetical protein